MQTPTMTFNTTPISSAGTVGYPAHVKAKIIIPPQANMSTSLSQAQANLLPATLELMLATSSTPLPILDSDIDPQLLAEPCTAPVNLHLKHAKANSEKKRKPESRAASSTNKKQKTKAVGLAIPNSSNSLRYVPQFFFTDI